MNHLKRITNWGYCFKNKLPWQVIVLSYMYICKIDIVTEIWPNDSESNQTESNSKLNQELVNQNQFRNEIFVYTPH